MAHNQRINRQIKAYDVVLIDSNGENLGKIKTIDALKTAEDAGLDLVEVSSPDAEIVVCKIMDYSRHRYQSQKKKQKSVSSQKKTKEIKMCIRIDKHDLGIKIDHGVQFLDTGHPVKTIIQLRGRDMQRKDDAFKIMDIISERFSKVAKIHEKPEIFGNVLSAFFIPDKKNKAS